VMAARVRHEPKRTRHTAVAARMQLVRGWRVIGHRAPWTSMDSGWRPGCNGANHPADLDLETDGRFFFYMVQRRPK